MAYLDLFNETGCLMKDITVLDQVFDSPLECNVASRITLLSLSLSDHLTLPSPLCCLGSTAVCVCQVDGQNRRRRSGPRTFVVELSRTSLSFKTLYSSYFLSSYLECLCLTLTEALHAYKLDSNFQEQTL